MSKKIKSVDVINISDVKVKDRFRSDLGDLDSLKESINRIGLLQPIGITKDNILVYGHRRLEAAKSLGWNDIPYVLIELDDYKKKLAELEENLKRKDMTWQEEVRAKAELHKLFQKLYGQPKAGYRSDLKIPISDSEKGWGLKNTAEFLGESIGLVSQDIKLAKALEDHQQLWEETNKSRALLQLKKIEHPEDFTKKPWKCDICGTELMGKKKKQRMIICSTCHIQVKPFSEIRVPKGSKKRMQRKYSFANLTKKGRLRI